MNRILSTFGIVALIGTLFSAGPDAMAEMQPVKAVTADDFVDSIGLNNLGGPYTSPYGGSRKALYKTEPVDDKYLMGVRHARFEIRPDSNITPLINLARDRGVRINALVSWLWTDPNVNKSANIADVLAVLRKFPPGSIASIEGNNEADMPFESGDFPRYASSPKAAQANQASLYQAVKSDEHFKHTPVIAWTIGKNWPWGNKIGYGQFTSTDFDFESLHAYPSGDTIDGCLHAPGHTEWLKVARSILPAGAAEKPIVVTETGFQHVIVDQQKKDHDSSLAQAKQETMLYAQFFTEHFVRTFIYSVGGERPWSMDTRDDGTPLPAGNALQFLTTTLGDAHWDRDRQEWATPHVDPKTLSLDLARAPTSVHHLLLQKADGSFYLLVWNDVIVWEGKAMADVNNPPVPVTLKLGDPFASAEIATMNPDGTYATRRFNLHRDGGTLSLPLDVPDSVMLVHLIPG